MEISLVLNEHPSPHSFWRPASPVVDYSPSVFISLGIPAKLWKWIVVCGAVGGLTDFASETIFTSDGEEKEFFSGLLFDLLSITFLVVPEVVLYAVFCIRGHRLQISVTRFKS